MPIDRLLKHLENAAQINESKKTTENLHFLFENQAAQSPERIALICDSLSINYLELNQKTNQLARYLKAIGVHSNTVVAIYLPRSIDLIISFLAVLKAGGAFLLLDSSDPSNRIDFILKDSQTHLARILVGGESCTPDLVEHHIRLFPKVSLWNIYGPTEATIWASFCKVYDKNIQKKATNVNIGHAIQNVNLYILDSNHQLCAPDQIGEIYIGRKGVARGYLNHSKLNAEHFIPDPFTSHARLYKTGDQGCYQPDGSITFLGRLNNQIKLLGHRVEFDEIEAVLNRYPGISQISTIAPHDNFFELGGHPLHAARIISKIAEQMGKMLSVYELHHHPRFDHFSKRVDQASHFKTGASTNLIYPHVLPLYELQFTYWITKFAEPKLRKCNVVSRKRFQGQINKIALDAALQWVLHKQDVFSYHIHHFYPLQTPCTKPSKQHRRWFFASLQHLPKTEAEAYLAQHCAQLFYKKFWRVNTPCNENLIEIARQAQQSSLETAEFQRAASLVKIAALGKQHLISKPLTGFLVNYTLTCIVRCFPKPQLNTSLIQACKTLALADRTKQFFININVHSNFLPSVHSTPLEEILGLPKQMIPSFTYPVQIIPYTFDIAFHRNNDQRLAYMTIATNLKPSFQKKIGEGLISLIMQH